jgi:hypothetical protein
MMASAAPTKQECVASNEQAQALREQEHLKAARDQLAVCIAAACPGPVRQDCAERIAEIERVMPTLVFEVRDEAGHDLTHVELRVDGKLTASALDGAPVRIDPGEHELSFGSGGAQLTKMFVVREGQKDRRERIVLTTPPPAPGRARRVGALVAGGVGVTSIVVGTVLGIVAKSTYDNALSSDCQGDPHKCTPPGISMVSMAHDEATVSTVGFVAGAVLVAGGVALWATSSHEVRVQPMAGGAALALGGTFRRCGGRPSLFLQRRPAPVCGDSRTPRGRSMQARTTA